MNTITITFVECSPAPANGYNILWRLAGSVGGYTNEGNVTNTPAVFTDSTNPDGSDYEGFITSDCTESGESGESGGNFGTPIPWTTVVLVCRNYQVTNNHPDTATFAYISCAGSTTPVFMTSGQTVTVCAQEGEVFVDGGFTVTPGVVC